MVHEKERRSEVMTTIVRTATAMAAALVATLPAVAGAQGMLVPEDPSLDPLNIESHRVKVTVVDGVAETTVDQVFRNDCHSALEATYIFPLPEDAAVSDFALWIGGKKQKGEILDKDEARKIYEGIVAQLKDPGLLEYMGGNLFKARVYPVPAKGTQKVEIAFTQKLSYHKNVYKYVYPLRTSGPSATTLEDFTFTADIESQVPIKTVYSPTHELDVQADAHRATVGFEKYQAALDRDLSLYYTVSEDAIGMSVLTHRVDDGDGTFMLLVSPGSVLPAEEIVGKQVTFVVDTSGSMSGEKMDNARKALSYCLEHLGSDDLFNVIRFSSTTEPFHEGLVPASKKNVEDAVERIEEISPLGGTAIESALRSALTQPVEKGTPHFVIFITDGMPTVGETDPDRIIEMVGELNEGRSSLFAFGVGDDVNVNFIDKLVADNEGSADYARTGGDLQMALSILYSKIAYPALTDVTLDIDGVKAREVFPRQMPDLFYGGQVVVVGRYDDGGKARITLAGRMSGGTKKVKYKVSLPDEDDANDFIEHIWATRKVGYLLDQIRLNGEEQELVDEVVAMSRRYGIVTPYTSYLVVEEGADVSQPTPLPPPPMPVWTPGGSGGAATPESAAPAAPKDYYDDELAMESLIQSGGSTSSSTAMGESAIKGGKKLKKMKEAEKIDSGPSLTRWVDGRAFTWKGGRWVDADYEPSMDTLEVGYATEGYFTLLSLVPELKDALSLGTDVVIVVGDDEAVVIGMDIEDSPGEKRIEEFLGQ
jgi:Ca-activated chloride channel family protein